MTKIDEINDRILQELTRDGRISNIDLAERVGLSPSACLRRVQELERSGIIKGYRAVIDRVALGQGFTVVMAVGLSRHTKEEQRAFERAVEGAEDVGSAGAALVDELALDAADLLVGISASRRPRERSPF